MHENGFVADSPSFGITEMFRLKPGYTAIPCTDIELIRSQVFVSVTRSDDVARNSYGKINELEQFRTNLKRMATGSSLIDKDLEDMFQRS